MIACHRSGMVRATALRSIAFSLAKGLLDRIEVGALWREIAQADAGGLDGDAHAGRLGRRSRR